MADRADSEHEHGPPMVHRGVGRNIALAVDLFSEDVRTNGVLVGAAGPKRRIQERLAGFPDLTTTIEDMFSAHDKIATRLVWRGTYNGSYGGVKAAGRPVEVRDFAVCRLAFRGQRGSGNLNDTGSVRASKADRIFPRRGLCGVAPCSPTRAAERGRRSAPCGGGAQARH